VSSVSADVVVVGGGPAGSATAAGLAKAGFHVILVDRSSFPRRKPCGECLNPGAVAAVRRLGLLEELLDNPCRSIRGWQIHPVAGPAFTGEFPHDEGGIAVRRNKFDGLLLEHARRSGAELRLGGRVNDLIREGGAVCGVQTTRGPIRARLVVGADGLRSVVLRRSLLLRRHPRLRKVALTAHVRNAATPGEWGGMHLTPTGCVGVADVGGGLVNVVVVVQGASAARIAGRREEQFDATLSTVPGLERAERIESVLATGPFDWPVRTAVADGVLLVGDAAGYYDPFTGQGIYRALRGAELSVPVAIDALNTGDVSARALHPYERARRRAFGPGQRMQYLIEQVTTRPRIFSVAARALARSPELARALVMVTGDARPLRSLGSPGLLVRVLAGGAV
jgi:menaquinone-9 beta-reductase